MGHAASRWWAAVAAAGGAIFILSIVPVDVDQPVKHLDKLAHLCQYLLLAWLLVRAMRSDPAAPSFAALQRAMPLWAWLFATSYGLLIEVLQALLPWRSADVADALMNGLGAAVGVAIGRKPR